MAYIHIGNDYLINDSDIVGIFDIDRCSVNKRTRSFLAVSQKNKIIIDAAEDIPKSFIVADGGVYISGLSSATLRQRIQNI